MNWLSLLLALILSRSPVQHVKNDRDRPGVVAPRSTHYPDSPPDTK